MWLQEVIIKPSAAIGSEGSSGGSLFVNVISLHQLRRLLLHFPAAGFVLSLPGASGPVQPLQL